MTRPLLPFAVLLAIPAAPAAEPPKPPTIPFVRSVAFAPDGKTLIAAVGRRDQPGAVAAWTADGREMLWQVRGPRQFGSLSFASDGKSVAVARGTPAALRFDPSTGAELGEVGEHPVPVLCCVHLPGTTLLATGSDGTVRLWDVPTNKLVKELKGGHPADVSALLASPDGKWLVTKGRDGARIWDVAAGTELKGVFRQEQGLAHYGDAFVAPDRVMFADNSATLRTLELPSGKEVRRCKGFAGVSAFSPQLGLAAYNWHGPTTSVMDLTFRDPTDGEAARIAALLKDFDDDSYEVRVAATEAMRKVGSVAEPLLRRAAEGGPSPEVRMRAREVRLAILESPLRTLKGHTAEVVTMTFSPDGTALATGAADGTVRLWDPRTGKELACLDVPDPTK